MNNTNAYIAKTIISLIKKDVIITPDFNDIDDIERIVRRWLAIQYEINPIIQKKFQYINCNIVADIIKQTIIYGYY
jgi:NifB/MoaA-like Fe-S oxidoreductase